MTGSERGNKSELVAAVREFWSAAEATWEVGNATKNKLATAQMFPVRGESQ